MVKGCRSQLKSKAHNLTRPPCIFDFHICLSFPEKNISKRSNGQEVFKNYLSGNFLHIPFSLSHGHLKHKKSEESTNI